VSLQLLPFDIDTLERDPATICGLDADLRIAYVNPAWLAFGRDNGFTWGHEPWTLGVELLSAVPPDLRPFYERLFDHARKSTGPVEHSYECSSPTVFRRYRMQVFRCDAGALLVAHSLLQETSHAEPSSPGIESIYRDAQGVLCQCSHCRRVRRAGATCEQWDWVPDFVAHVPANTSHGLCPLCSQYYFPG
jgi:hypothetical protein